MKSHRASPWKRRFSILALLALGAALPAAAEETRIAVRVLSKDAKLIGTSMGGARVTIHDADTGALLADGVTAGSTGDTARLVREPRQRRAAISTPGAAGWSTTLDLDRPRRLRITAYGPLAQLQSAAEATVTLWALPGKHLDGGDGVVLELSGFVVDILAPAAHVRLGSAPQEVEVEINLTML